MLSTIALPTLCVFNTGPLPSLYNQVLAFTVWGISVKAMEMEFRLSTRRRARLIWQWLTAAGLLVICVAGSMLFTGLPAGLAICEISFCAAAAIVALTAVGVSRPISRSSVDWPLRFIWAVLLAAVLNCVPAMVQSIRPDWVDGTWIASMWSADRISGNVRQPNLLATICVSGIAAAACLFELGRVSASAAKTTGIALLLTIAVTGSRIGAAEIAAMACWPLLDARLTTSTRRSLFAMPFLLLAFWSLLQWWSHSSGLLHGRAPDLTSGRYIAWAQCLTLIRSHPWFGVGLGNFNFAWTLTPFDRTNPETFDHAHNLLLHWAVELGIPITVVLTTLLGSSLWRCFQLAQRAKGDESVVRRFCLVFIVMLLLHSMTEYPLWYAYLLLPVAFAWGLAASPIQQDTRRTDAIVDDSTRHLPSQWLGTAGLLMALGAALAAFDYQKIVDIYHPWFGAPPQEERMAAGRQAVLYGYLADRFAGTLAVNGGRTLEPYKTATRQLIDMRLLIAWALGVRESGDIDKARYLAQRIKDFDSPVSNQFFSACLSTQQPPAEPPWQCIEPIKKYTYKDFL